MLTKKIIIVTALLALNTLSWGAEVEHPCPKDARVTAKALLTFHTGIDASETIVHSDVVFEGKISAPMSHEALEVLKVDGAIYGSPYLMKFKYAQNCLLMGQEILDLSQVSSVKNEENQ